MLRPPAEPECGGLRCAARVLDAIHYPGMGGSDHQSRGERARARAEQAEGNRGQQCQGAGEEPRSKRVGLQVWVDQEGRMDR